MSDTCTIDADGNVTGCKTLESVEVDKGQGIHFGQRVDMSDPWGKGTRHPYLQLSGGSRKFRFLKFCPFCGTNLKPKEQGT